VLRNHIRGHNIKGVRREGRAFYFSHN
jgi:hypothetical protein